MGLVEDKHALRVQMRSIRDGISLLQRKDYEDALAERLYNLPAVRNSRVMGVYQAYGSEASLDDLVKALRLLDPSPVIAYPAMLPGDIITFAAVERGEKPAYVDNPASIQSFESIAKDRDVRPEDIDLLFVPGIAFDEECHRLGQGGGCYDRFIPHLKGDCLVVGVAFDEQICQAVPFGVHDRRMDYVVTPSRIIQR
ncbi:MAG: 5-formyltetrahydrofolate cyclo-ligase [Coriobacteriales bacterium]